eukprot:NODE_2_length_91304_cov_0.692462.p52 type:complete len:189 gc:universal NODE_2_length_91304_cov_0.692462:28777-29343(+)
MADTIGDNIQWRAKQHDRKKKRMQQISEENLKLLDGTVKGQYDYVLARAHQCEIKLEKLSIERFVEESSKLIENLGLTVIVASGALRCIAIIKNLKHEHNCVAKLFAKHLKIDEQVKFLNKPECYLGVGTPQRILKLPIEPKLIIFDASYVDMKKKTIFDHKDIRIDALKCVDEYPNAKICLWSRSIE